MYDFTIIGTAVLDVLAKPVDASVFETGSHPAEMTKLAIGGDAINEATVLTRLGKKVNFISKIGKDAAGDMILNHCRENGIGTEQIKVQEGLDTSVNLVLIGADAERSFVTNPHASQRKLALEDVDFSVLDQAKIACFASIFVHPYFTDEVMEELFSAIKKTGAVLCADMTKHKKGELLEDIKKCLPYIDYLFPNYEEAAMVTGKTDIHEIADAFLDYGVGCIVIKVGKDGCLIKTKDQCFMSPAVPNTNCVDTTGAGDNFAAGFLYALSEGMTLEACGRFANATASIAVEEIGATTGVRSAEQVYERLKRLEHC